MIRRIRLFLAVFALAAAAALTWAAANPAGARRTQAGVESSGASSQSSPAGASVLVIQPADTSVTISNPQGAVLHAGWLDPVFSSPTGWTTR